MVLHLGVVDDQGGDGSALVLIGPHREVLVAGGQLAMDRMPPGEHWRRLAATLDLPEDSSVGAHGLGASLTLVN